jgi:hypothetical protein
VNRHETHELYNNLMECTPGSMSCHVVFTEREDAGKASGLAEIQRAQFSMANPATRRNSRSLLRPTSTCRCLWQRLLAEGARWSLATNVEIVGSLEPRSGVIWPAQPVRVGVRVRNEIDKALPSGRATSDPSRTA